MAYYAQPPPQYAYPPQPQVVVMPPRPPPIIVAGPSQPPVIIHHGGGGSRLRPSRRHGSSSYKVHHTHSFNLRRSKRGRKRRSSSKSRRITMNIGDDFALEKLSQRMNDLQATGTPLEVFVHAYQDMTRENTDLMKPQWDMASRAYRGEHYGLSLYEDDQRLLFAQAEFNKQVTERTVDITFKDIEHPQLSMNGTLRFMFDGNPGESISTFDVFVADDTKALTSVRVNLYDTIHHETYAHFQVPTLYATLELRYNPNTALYDLLSVRVTLDLIPEHSSVVTHLSHIDRLPTLHKTSLDVVRWSRDRQYVKPLHDALEAQLRERFAEGQERSSQWHLVTNGGDSGTTSSRTHKVLWGEIADAFNAYAIVEDLGDGDLDSAEFLMSSIGTTDNGKALIALVSKLYANLHKEGVPNEPTVFPTLRQVLLHTTGLPNNALLEYSHIVDYYDSVIEKLKNAERELANDDGEREVTIDAQIAEIIEHLKAFDAAVVDPDTIVGSHRNVFEALILFMYLRATMQRRPLDLLKQKALDRFAVHLSWGIEGPTDPDNPHSLLTCAHSNFGDLVKFTSKIFDELEHRDSVVVRTLLNPVFTNNESRVARTIGWSLKRTRNNIDIIFATQGKCSLVDASLVFFIPELHVWGVVNEHVLDFNKHLSFDSKVFFELLVNTIEGLDVAADQRPRHAIEHLPFASYSRKRVKTPLIERHAELAGREYYDPFLDVLSGKHHRVTLKRDGEDGDLSLVGEDGRHTLKIGYTGRDDVFFRIEDPFVDGDVIVVTPEFVSVGGRFFLDKTKVRDLTSVYKTSLSFAQKKISMDIHTQTHIVKLREIRPHDLVASQFFAENVGAPWGRGRGWGWGRRPYRRPWGGFGPGLALGALAASAAYPPYYAGYPYGPYGYY